MLDFYVSAVDWTDTSSSKTVVGRRARLHGIHVTTAPVSTSLDVKAIELRNGSASGDILYKVAVPSGKYFNPATDDYTTTFTPVPLMFGGNGILFTDGIYADMADGPVSGSSAGNGVENVVFFFV